MKLYELTYLPLPGLSEDEQKTLSERVVSILETQPVSQHSSGFLATLDFNSDPEKIGPLKEKLKKELLSIVGKHLDLNSHRLFFFGFRAGGKGSERSDIDVGIEGPEKISLPIMARMREEIEDLPLLYKIDLVDFKDVSFDFREVALQNIEPIL